VPDRICGERNVHAFLFFAKQSQFMGDVPVQCMRMGWLILDGSWWAYELNRWLITRVPVLGVLLRWSSPVPIAPRLLIDSAKHPPERNPNHGTDHQQVDELAIPCGVPDPVGEDDRTHGGLSFDILRGSTIERPTSNLVEICPWSCGLESQYDWTHNSLTVKNCAL
jgi:hypothetical protein